MQKLRITDGFERMVLSHVYTGMIYMHHNDNKQLIIMYMTAQYRNNFNTVTTIGSSTCKCTVKY